MGELSPLDVQVYTKSRLTSSDAEVQRMLTAALSVARRHVGWHVSPVRTAEAITLDGPDSRVLWLPTLKLVALTAVSEDGTTLNLGTVRPSAGDGPGLPRRVALRKRSKGYWSGEYGGISLVMSHGFTEDEAADWRQAILSMVDQMSLIPVGADGMSRFGQNGIRVDDVDLRYNPYAAMAEDVLFSVGSVLDDYRLPAVEFM